MVNILKKQIDETEHQKKVRVKANWVLKKIAECLDKGYEVSSFLREIPSEFRENKEYILMAISANPFIYSGLTIKEKEDELIINTAIKTKSSFITTLNEKERNNIISKIDPDIAEEAVLKSPLMFKYFKECLTEKQSLLAKLVALNLSIITDIPRKNIRRMKVKTFADGLRANPSAVRLIEKIPIEIRESIDFLLEIEDLLEEKKNSLFLPEYALLYQKLSAIHRERELRGELDKINKKTESHIKRKI